jgi:phospholipid transport system substrate-binding protein
MLSALLASLALSVTLAGSASPPGPSAQQTFETSHHKVVELVRAKAKDVVLEKEVDRFLDYGWIARQSLGGPDVYESRCAPRCAEFEGLLTTLIRHNYLSRIRQSDNGTLEILGEEYRQEGTMAKIDTRVAFTRDGKPMSLAVDYVLHRADDTWKVRDIYTDGVGLAKTYRHDFKKMHAQGGIDLLIERLQAKVDSLHAATSA